MATFDLKSYARRGAETRVQELQEELEAIYSAFPEMRPARRGRPAGSGQQRGSQQAQAAAIGEAESGGARRKRKGMTAAQRKAVGERMRKYWAERRKKNK